MEKLQSDKAKGKNIKLQYEQKEQMRFEMDRERDEIEAPILKETGYDLIFPVKDNEAQMRKYNSYLKLSKDL